MLIGLFCLIAGPAAQARNHVFCQLLISNPRHISDALIRLERIVRGQTFGRPTFDPDLNPAALELLGWSGVPNQELENLELRFGGERGDMLYTLQARSTTGLEVPVPPTFSVPPFYVWSVMDRAKRGAELQLQGYPHLPAEWSANFNPFQWAYGFVVKETLSWRLVMNLEATKEIPRSVMLYLDVPCRQAARYTQPGSLSQMYPHFIFVEGHAICRVRVARFAWLNPQDKSLRPAAEEGPALGLSSGDVP